MLLVGYVPTNAVYAFTFGQYLGHVLGLGEWVTRGSGVAVIAAYVLLNLKGAGKAGGVEVVMVWFKVFVLVALAAVGIARWAPGMMSRGVEHAGLLAALAAAASVFMAYEGFQLLAYDYDDIRDPDRTLPRAMLLAIGAVI